MKPKLVHQEVMDLSFRAKQAIDAGDFLSANDYYIQAAEKEGELARFYFDKPELEPTRSSIVRSAAFLHLKAGLVHEAQQFIFWGLLNIQDAQIKQQLEEALELAVALKNTDIKSVGYNVEYFKLLRMRSINYTMEPAHQNFGNVVSLEMFRDFASDYLRSLRAYAAATFIRADSVIKKIGGKVDDAVKQFDELVNPLITTSGIGSFTFSIANDFLSRGEERELVKLKADIIINYHERIFINPLDDIEIGVLKRDYKDDEINQIFKPITRIKSSNSAYKVAYFDIEAYRKKYIAPIAKAQRAKLLPLHPLSAEDIGVLESSIVHSRQLNDGKKKRNVIQREQLKTFQTEFKIAQIEPKDSRPLILNESIVIDVNFDAEKGFTFTFDELNVSHTDIDYSQGLQSFYGEVYKKLVDIAALHKGEKKNTAEWQVAARLLNNPESLVK